MIPVTYFQTDAEDTRIISRVLLPLIGLADMKRRELYEGEVSQEVDLAIRRTESFFHTGNIAKFYDDDNNREYPLIGNHYNQPLDIQRVEDLISVAMLVYIACQEQSDPAWWAKFGGGFSEQSEHLAMMRRRSADDIEQLISRVRTTVRENHNADIHSVQ